MLLVGVTVGGFVGYDHAGPWPRPAAPADTPPAPRPNPLPVGVEFRPAGAGQAVFLTGAPGGTPLTVRVTAPHASPPDRGAPLTLPDLPDLPERDKPGNGKPRRAKPGAGVKTAAGVVLGLWLQHQEARRNEDRDHPPSAVVVVRPGLEAQVVWAARDFLLPPGQAVTLTCPGYDTLRTSTSVPLKGPVPAVAASPTHRLPTGYRPPHPTQLPPRLPGVDPGRRERAGEPPGQQLTIRTRESGDGNGRVLEVANAGPAAVVPLKTRVVRPGLDATLPGVVVAEYRLDSGLGPGQAAELSWRELNVEVRVGDRVELLVADALVKSVRVE